ncbi:MAG: antibiotic biosynthesis monooxygenase [Alphaproteobacteria bacterium]
MLVNPFTCAPGRESELLEILAEATDQVVRHLPGFISASFAKGVEPGHVVNVAMWELIEHYKNFLQEPKARLWFGKIVQVAESTDPHLYHLAHHHVAERTETAR